ncbi:signal peptidase I [Ammoniphilus resinae]|uniref:Signal peptidase I n=1 Tax=Ammoniphilus resinae TaxID=861532 RepID=A0ABS4GNZ4_9BACL|nr:signal peptidase I [Ammoniphilus resinae]MBP1931993.1 signal peptidase I [Ammoniphilus resinae]
MKNFSLIISFLFVLFLVGCSEQSVETITDSDTKEEVPIINTITSDMIVIHPMNDAMDRGNHDFFNRDVVVDTMHYKKNELKRGDIIHFELPKKADQQQSNEGKTDSLTRVIALAGEKVKIKKGQFYINGKKLDTFYGKAHRLGLDLEELKKMLDEGNYGNLQHRRNVESNVSSFESANYKEVTVPENHVYVIGDDWFRTTSMGLLPKENIKGKVLGFKK